MAMTFDATLKDMGRASPEGFLATFDRAPQLPLKLLNVDLSTVTTAADLMIGLGEPLEEIVHLDFQSSAAAWKHADVLVYNALAFSASSRMMMTWKQDSRTSAHCGRQADDRS